MRPSSPLHSILIQALIPLWPTNSHVGLRHTLGPWARSSLLACTRCAANNNLGHTRPSLIYTAAQKGFFAAVFPVPPPNPRVPDRRRRVREQATAAARSSHPSSADTPSSFLFPRTNRCFWFPCGVVRWPSGSPPRRKRYGHRYHQHPPNRTGSLTLHTIPLTSLPPC
jgi:hypothetical protein